MTPIQRRRSMTYANVVAIHILIGATCLSLNILTLVALKLGATEVFLGILSFAIVGTYICRVFTMAAIEKHGKRKILFFWKTIATVSIILFVCLPLLTGYISEKASLALLLTATILYAIANALGDTGWMPLLQDVVPNQITGRFFANIRTLWQTSSLITLLLIAWLLGKTPEWWKFEIVFITAFIASIIGTLSILGMTENPLPSVKLPKISIYKRFREVLLETKLRFLVLYITSYWLAAAIAEPFKIKFLKDIGYSYGFILAAVAMLNLGAIFSLRFWGKLADRFGNHSIFSISHIGIAICTVFWIFVAKNTFGAIFILMLFFFWSVFNSGNGIAQTRYILHIIPADKQNQINIMNIIANLSMGISPLLAGLFLYLTKDLNFGIAAKRLSNYHILFIISAMLFILPHLMRRKLKLHKDRPTTELIAFVTRPLRTRFGPFIRIRKKNKPI